MSLEGWLLIAVITLLVACLILLAFMVFAPVDWLPHRVRLHFARQFEGWQWRSYSTPEMSDVDFFIRRNERSRGLRLTVSARQMLMIPVEERLYDRGDLNLGQVEDSIGKLFEVLRYDDSDSSRSGSGALNSVAVIKAFHAKFCNIPPFCASTESEGARDR